MKQYQAHIASDEAFQLAEGPVWDEVGQRVLWVDIPAGNVHIGTLWDYGVAVTETHHVDETVGAVTTTKTGDLLVAGHQVLHRLTPTGDLTEVRRLIPAGQRRRFNDGACDPSGRFLIGTLTLGEPGHETLYQVDPVEGVSIIDDDLALSNGIAWSPDGTTLYTVDTTPGTIWARPYDPHTGQWGQREVAFQITDGSPDGICVDTDGNLWVAVWGQGEIRCLSPNGTLTAVVHVAAPHTSSVAFVGPDRSRLLITTAKDDLSDRELAENPGSGHLFLADVDAHGVPTSSWT
ncbi:SMP-30/gluconolactonase/LRE family protein [Rhodococcus koreensis]